jgi:hypothetical protein
VQQYKSSKPISTTNFDLEDIPILMDKHFDPFMALEAANGERDRNAKRFVFSQLNRPRIIRSRGREARSSCEQGFLAKAIEATGAMSLRPGTGHVGPDVARARLEAQRAMSSDASRRTASANGMRGASNNNTTRNAVSGGAVRGLFGGLDVDDMTVLTVQTGLPRITDSNQLSENLFSANYNSLDRPKSTPGRGGAGYGVGDMQSVSTFQTGQTHNRSRPGSSGGSLVGSSRIPPSTSYGEAAAAARGRPDAGQARRDRSNSPLSRSPPRTRPGTSG